MTWRILAIGTCALVSAACVGKNVRELTQTELDVLNRMQARLAENRSALNEALYELENVGAQAVRDQHSLSLSLSKAQLLESMKSPWVNPQPELASTQREVALYHLYALAEAERELLVARLRERRASFEEVRTAYDRLAALTAEIIEAEKLILAHLEQPASARLSLLLGEILAESKAFRETLAASEGRELRALADEVESAEEKVARARDAIEEALKRLPESRR